MRIGKISKFVEFTRCFSLIFCNIGAANGPLNAQIGWYVNYVIEGLMVVVYAAMFIAFVLRKSRLLEA